jgi:hypothetical protein
MKRIEPKESLLDASRLGINAEKVCHVIVKARTFDGKEGVVDSEPGSNAADDGMSDILEDFPDDATMMELIEFIRSLDQEEQINLVALAWLGRGTYDPSEWADAQKEATRAHNPRTAQYLVGLPMLGDYLEEGLAYFGGSCEGFEMGRL